MSFFRTARKLTRSGFRAPLTSTSTTTTYTTGVFTRDFKSSALKMGVHNLSSRAEFQSAIKDNNIVVLDAFATWCGPCKVIAPTVVQYSDDFPNVHFVKVDVDEVPDVAQELSIRAMPTFLVFKGGEKVAEVVGADKGKLKQAIEDAVKEG